MSLGLDIDRYITKEDFLNLKSWEEGGTQLGSRWYAAIGSYENNLKQLDILGKIDKTGEGVIDKVFFFEVFRYPKESEESNFLFDADLKYDLFFEIVCAKVVRHYKFGSVEECKKELALIKAKIGLQEKKKLKK